MSFSRHRVADASRSADVPGDDLVRDQNLRLLWACLATLVAGVCMTLISNYSFSAKVVVSASLVGIICLSVTLYEVARSAENIRRFVRNVWLVAICGLLPIVVSDWLIG
jgi:hypothetical protein